METRLIFAIIAMLISGIYGFLQKVDVESAISRSTFIMYSWICMFFYATLYLILTGTKLSFEPIVLWTAVINWTVYSIVFHYRLKSLKFLDTSTFFINYRILSSILLMFVWMIFWNEIISTKEYLWIFLWFITFFLLMEKKYKWESDKKLWKWYAYLMVWVVWVSILQSLQKNFAIHDYSYPSYLFYSWIVGSINTYLLKAKDENLKKILTIKDKKTILFLFFAGIIFTLYTLTWYLWIKFWWNMVVVYKIISYSLFIPIILSMIFYWEKITMKKALAFILTIISIWLFAS